MRALALRRVARHDRVTDNDRRDTLADRLHHRGRLVSENGREYALGICTTERVDVRVAQGVADHLHPHLPSLWWVHDDGLRTDVIDSEGHHGLARDRLCIV